MAFKTLQQLTAATDAQGGDLIATVRSTGPLQSLTLALLRSTYLDVAYAPLAEAFLIATVADILAGTSTTKGMTPGDAYGAFAEVALTDAATIAVDMSAFLNAAVTLGGNRTLGNPTNPKVGQTGYIRLIQDATGSRTLAFGSAWKRQGGAPTLSTAAGAVDVLVYEVISASYVLYDVKLNPS